MTALECLKSLKNHIECEVCEKLKLQADNSEEYVHPNCHIMHLPNANFNPNSYTVPFIAIELDSATDDEDESTLDIRLTIATYGGGYYLDDFENRTNIPDGNGYIDLINAIELTKQALLRKVTLDGEGVIRKPLNYGTYDIDVPYPYWYGFIKFKVDIPNNDIILNSEREEF